MKKNTSFLRNWKRWVWAKKWLLVHSYMLVKTSAKKEGAAFIESDTIESPVFGKGVDFYSIKLFAFR